AVGDQDALAARGDVGVGLDQIAAASNVRRDLARQVTHAGMKDVAPAGAVKAAGIDDEALAKTVVERQHLVLLGLLPPELDQGRELFAMRRGEIVRLGKVLIEMKQLPSVVLVRCAGRMKCDRLPPCVP